MMTYNGQIVLRALAVLGGRAPLSYIIRKVSTFVNRPIKDIKDTVKETIEGGITHGFLQKKGYHISFARLGDNVIPEELKLRVRNVRNLKVKFKGNLKGKGKNRVLRKTKFRARKKKYARGSPKNPRKQAKK